MSMGATMMQHAELRRKEAEAKGRPSSVSKRQVVVTGAAAMIPGRQSLSACSEQSIANVFAEDVDLSDGKWIGGSFLAGPKGKPRLLIEPLMTCLEIYREHLPNDRPYRVRTFLTSCEDPDCGFLTAVRKPRKKEALDHLNEMRERAKRYKPEVDNLLTSHVQ